MIVSIVFLSMELLFSHLLQFSPSNHVKNLNSPREWLYEYKYHLYEYTLRLKSYVSVLAIPKVLFPISHTS